MNPQRNFPHAAGVLTKEIQWREREREVLKSSVTPANIKGDPEGSRRHDGRPTLPPLNTLILLGRFICTLKRNLQLDRGEEKVGGSFQHKKKNETVPGYVGVGWGRCLEIWGLKCLYLDLHSSVKSIKGREKKSSPKCIFQPCSQLCLELESYV